MPRCARPWSCIASLLRAALAALVLAACDSQQPSATGTAQQRAALFDYIIDRTAEREAFSPVKNRVLGFDPLDAMRAHRGDVVSATSAAELFYALVRTSNARRDRHLSVALVPGGLQLADSTGLEVLGSDAVVPTRHAPVKFLPDYTDGSGYDIFVSDVARDWSDRIRLGDRLLAVNGETVAQFHERVEPYLRYSSIPNLSWNFAAQIPQRSAVLPTALYRDRLHVELEHGKERYAVSLPYLPADSLAWTDTAEPTYDGFALTLQTGTYDLHVSERGLPVIVLRWHGFRASLVEDVDSLMAIAVRRRWLDHAVIVDATRSRGGSKGAYAVQRLVSRPFKTTFGNLRMSDVIPPFIAAKRAEYEAGRITDGDVRETLDDGRWLLDWLETDVVAAYEGGAAYSNDVPFKLAHAPRTSDGILKPAPVHFRGPLIVFSGPRGGSHLDQFVAIIVDNDLGHVIGIPAGGYSNTWEWEETLVYPGTEQPVVQFMWSIGHTIRPNGEILEGNPAPVQEPVPLTRANFQEYYDLLMQRALTKLGLEM